jgi:hypothetical protein
MHWLICCRAALRKRGQNGTIRRFFLALLLVLFAFIVFRVFVRRDYAAHGRLKAFSSSLQLFVFTVYIFFTYLFNPSQWVLFWRFRIAPMPALYQAGYFMNCAGLLISFGTMAWFGIKRALGLQSDGLLMVLGFALQWPSLYSAGWALIFLVMMHWMIRTEEEHLLRVFGDACAKYCREVPRYLLPRRIDPCSCLYGYRPLSSTYRG